jgi:hypothetical protein
MIPAARIGAILLTMLGMAALPPSAHGAAADALRARLAELRPALERNDFGRPLHIDSSEAGGAQSGLVHALVAQPFATVSEGLSDAADWCGVLVLPFNVLGCEARGDILTMYIGRTPRTPIKDATRIALKFAVVSRTPDFMEVQLTAPTGPAGTRDYRIAFAATPADRGRTFVRMQYGYSHGTLSRLALQTYLATSGAEKVGFSKANGELVGGVRGVTERNTMRYFLAIEAYLDSLAAPAGERVRTRLERWFDATERYPRQLHEMTREEYLALKTASPAQRTASSSP